MHFADRLVEAVRRTRTCLCVGLDPRWESLPQSVRDRHVGESLEARAAGYEEFCLTILDLIAPMVGIVKPQSAFFEACGPAGLRTLQSVMRRAKQLNMMTILDAKRGDIASTAEAYAEAAFGVYYADALTVNPYLGRHSVEPFVAAARQDGRGVFILVRTSNPGAGLFQDLDCGGRLLHEAVGDAVQTWSRENLGQCGYGDVGAVVGATHPADLAKLRARLPNVWFLVPGYGAQGGSAAAVQPALGSDGLGAVVNSSRGITFPFHPDDNDWREQIVAATKRAINDLSLGL